jgi:hypothetical protein
LFLFIPGIVVVPIYVSCEVDIGRTRAFGKLRFLPDAEVHALDLSGAVKIVAAGGSLFAPDAVAERCLHQGTTRSLKWHL